jgi:hypothetical protein
MMGAVFASVVRSLELAEDDDYRCECTGKQNQLIELD